MDNTITSVEIKIQSSQIVNGRTVTSRQLEALLAVQDTGSKNSAAKKLGISVPVLHRYILSISKAAGAPVIKSNSIGSSLTDEGKYIAKVARAMICRSKMDHEFTVCCSPVTEDLIISVLSTIKIPNARVIISDDEYNIHMMRENYADVAIIDDPLYLFDAEEFEMEEVGYMNMVFVDNGQYFIKYKYGAQRIAFMFLDSEDRQYTIDSETLSISELLGSNKSFFIDEFLLTKRNIRIRSAVDPKMLRHAITAIYHYKTSNVDKLIKIIISKNI